MRTSLIVQYENEGFISSIDERMFNVAYNSKKLKYVYLYFNLSNKERVLNFLNNSEYNLEIIESLNGVEQIAI